MFLRFSFTLSGILSDQGRISSIGTFPIELITRFKYDSGTKPFALAVCIMENNLADAFAPVSDFENKKFLLKIVNGLIALSHILFVSAINRPFP